MTLMLASDATRRTPWFSVPVAQAERRRGRDVPVAEIMVLHKFLKANKKFTALERALRSPARQAKKPKAKHR